MLTRRGFLERTLQGVVAGATVGVSELWGAGQLAWSKPIGLEMYTVRELFAKDPAGTLKKVAAVGYQEVEIGPGVKPADLTQDLRAAGLTAPSGYLDVPKTVEQWKKTLDQAHAYGLRYAAVGDNPHLDAETWKRRADLFNECGRLSQRAGIQFCYHNHFREFARVDNTTGYDIMLTQCDPKLLKMEMDIFWAVYAGQDPLAYFRQYPGRFPLLHIKDLKPGFATSTSDFPYDRGPNPFAPAGQGRIDWKAIFAHARQAGAQHIFVEQDRCDGSPLDAIKISYEYLRKLQLS